MKFTCSHHAHIVSTSTAICLQLTSALFTYLLRDVLLVCDICITCCVLAFGLRFFVVYDSRMVVIIRSATRKTYGLLAFNKLHE